LLEQVAALNQTSNLNLVLMAQAVGVKDICFVSLLIKLRTVHEILSEEKMDVCLNQG
jgi:hypothetical protein